MATYYLFQNFQSSFQDHTKGSKNLKKFHITPPGYLLFYTKFEKKSVKNLRVKKLNIPPKVHFCPPFPVKIWKIIYYRCLNNLFKNFNSQNQVKIVRGRHVIKTLFSALTYRDGPAHRDLGKFPVSLFKSGPSQQTLTRRF